MPWIVALMAARLLLAAPPDPDPGLIAHYSFDLCDGRDALDGQSTATVYGAHTCRCGVVGEALAFDGRSTYLELDGPINAYFTTSDFTLSFYLKPTGRQPLAQALLVKADDCSLDGSVVLSYASATRTLDTHLHESAHKSYRHLDYTLLAEGWLHYTLVREGGEARTYLNGELQRETRRCSGVDLTSAAPLRFGRPHCRTSPFRGLLDELRVYDRALTPAEVRAVYRRAPVESAEADCLS